MGSHFTAPTPAAPLGQLLVGSHIHHKLEPGQKLRIEADTNSWGHTLTVSPRPGEPDPLMRAEAPIGEVTVLGPFDAPAAFRVHCDYGALIVRVV